jgi:hypothetical protein
MASLESILIGAIEIIAGAFLLATGIGGGLGVKLLLAGTLTLISAFMSARTGQNGFKSSPTYGYDNLGNAQYEGSPIPIIYGEHKVQPGIVSTNLKSEGGAQVLYLLCLISEGPIESISQVRLNDVAIETFPGAVATVDRLGQAGQTCIPGFNETGVQYPAATRLTLDSTHVHEMHGDADQLTLALVFQGLNSITSNGKLSSASWTGKVECKPYGSADSSYVKVSPDSSDANQGWTLDANQSGTWKCWGSTRDALRLQIPVRFDGKSGRPNRGRYTVRLTSMGPSKSNVTNVPDVVAAIEINNDSRTYDGLALLGLKLPASAQLNGIPQISCVAKGRKVLDPRTGLTAWSDNPVLCAYDLLTNTTYGCGVSSGKLDTTSWNAMADACDVTVSPIGGGSAEAKWRLDYVVDVQSVGTDHLSQMLSTCRMTLVNADRKVYVVQDAAKATSRDFEARAAAASSNRRNVRDNGSPARSTLIASSLDALQRWTKVRIVYVDRNRDWKQRRIEIFDQYINIGAVSGGTFGVGHKIKGTTSKAIGILTASYADGARSLTFAQDDGAVPFASGETITDLTSGASATSSSAPYTVSPERVLDLQMFGVTRRTQAIREARYALNNARSRTRFATWGGFLGDLDLLPGDTCTVSADHLPWTSRVFTILSMGFDADGLATFQTREYNADVYSDNVDTTQVDSLAYVPGGSVPPGLRPPGTDTPSSTGSTANVVNIDQGGFFTPGASKNAPPFGIASSVSVSTAPAQGSTR